MKRITGTDEWANSTYNIMSGCEHDCLYCYAKQIAIRFDRSTKEDWKDPFEKAVNPCGKRKGTVMFPSAHDITPNNYDACESALQMILEAGNNVLIVSKPHFKCIQKLCLKFGDYKDKILFRFSIGSVDDEILKFWEPNAPGFTERLDALIYAQASGFATSVSCEPTLDWEPHKLVSVLEPYVTNTIWIGKMNQMAQRVKMNCDMTPKLAREMCLIQLGQSDVHIKRWYAQLHMNPKIKWKDEIKLVMGFKSNELVGMDE